MMLHTVVFLLKIAYAFPVSIAEKYFIDAVISSLLTSFRDRVFGQGSFVTFREEKLMPTRRYALETAGSERLEVTWGWTIYSPCTIRLDGHVITTFSSRELQAGKNIRLPDGSSLSVKALLPGLLQVLRNGKRLPGSVSERPRMVMSYIIFLYVVGGIGGLVGIGVGLAILSGGIPADNGTVLGLLTMILPPLIAVLFFVIARGLWRLQNWARLSMIGLLSLLLLGGIVLGLSNPEELGSRLIGFVVLLVALAYSTYWLAVHGDMFGPPGSKKTSA